ncbi:MAG TPA: hypothetical protein VGT41_06675 [Candidatus Babeliales bacterium]|nr:hypothetical protein [Candidatus Babeliales bacterium]
MIHSKIIALCAVACISSLDAAMQHQDFRARRIVIGQQLIPELQRPVHSIRKNPIANGEQYVLLFPNKSIGWCTYTPAGKYVQDQYHYEERNLNREIVHQHSGQQAQILFKHYRLYAAN